MKPATTQRGSFGHVTFVGLVLLLVVLELGESARAHPGHEVPPLPIQYRAETEEQVAAWELALDTCQPVTVLVPTVECIEALGEYFLDRPVWDYPYTDFYYGLHDFWAIPPVLGTLVRKRFKYDDFAMEQIPLWRDIFDGQFDDRKKRFVRVMSDPVCVRFADIQAGGIDESMSIRCDAYEMYKYSATIDACFRSHQLLVDLRKPSRRVDYVGLTQFDQNFLEVEANIQYPDLRLEAKRRMVRGYLRASWLSAMCRNNTFAMVSEALEPLSTERALFSYWEDREQREKLENTYDISLHLAVKSGNEWAIRSYTPSPDDSDELKHDLLQRFPILTHRNLADYYGSRGSAEKHRHQAKAYLLLKEMAGTEVADREWEDFDLQEEIDYILEGGELRPYPTRAEYREERDRIRREREARTLAAKARLREARKSRN